MPGPFDPVELAPAAAGDPGPVAIVVEEDAQVDAYLAAGPIAGPYVVVKTAADVPAKLGGMALVRDGDLEPELQVALLRALGVSSSPGA